MTASTVAPATTAETENPGSARGLRRAPCGLMLRPQASSSQPQAFTLVELLVVITIIVVLLALLAPALDKAIYQAELAVCGAKQHALGMGVIAYAAGQRRAYPYRSVVQDTTLTWPSNVKMEQPQLDDRARLQPYFALNATLSCPLLPELDIEGSQADTRAFGTYNLWFGFRFTDTSNRRSRGMLRVGDQLEWYDNFRDEQVRSSILAATRYQVTDINQHLLSATHPGYDESWRMVKAQDTEAFTGTQGVEGTGAHGYKLTVARWDSSGLDVPKFVDLNAVYDDLSVVRYTRVDYRPDRDGRMARVPAFSYAWGWDNQEYHELIPKQ